MTAVLGIDAAWSSHNPSGVALVARAAGRWRCVAVAPSYRTFLDLAAGRVVPWSAPKIVGDPPDVAELLRAARQLLGGVDVEVVAIDMPVSTKDITARRASDDAISRMFGAAGCSTHSPSATRPGALGRELTDTFGKLGYPVAVKDVRRPERALVEVYPHPALLTLTGDARRLPYKIGKRARTWASVRPHWERILASLHERIDGVALPLPVEASRSSLKRWEDALDALVCAWVGVEYVEGRAVPYGDATAAIWCPTR